MEPVAEHSVMDMPAQLEPSNPAFRLKEEILRRVSTYVKAFIINDPKLTPLNPDALKRKRLHGKPLCPRCLTDYCHCVGLQQTFDPAYTWTSPPQVHGIFIPKERISKTKNLVVNDFHLEIEIFMLQCCSLSQDKFVLSNEDTQAHGLVEALDSVFFHGLKAPKHGYWALAKELSHPTVVSDIMAFENVTSDMGRGRAWLYVSLNEHLLESYLRHLTENTRIVNKFYSKKSFLCDMPLVHSLLSLTSGLENVRIELNGNLLFLDISFPKRTGRSETECSDDLPRDMTASTASTDSGCSQASAETAESYDCTLDNPFLPSPCNPLAKVKAKFRKSSQRKIVVGERLPVEPPCFISRRGSSTDLLRKPGKTFDVDVPATDEPIEWTAVRPMRRAPRKRKARRPSQASSTPSTSMSGDSTPESGYKSSFVDNAEAGRLHEMQESRIRDVVDRLGGTHLDEDAVLAHILSKDIEPVEEERRNSGTEERVEQCAKVEFVREISIYDRVTSPHDSDATLTLAEDSSTTLEDSGSHALPSSCNEPCDPSLTPSAEALPPPLPSVSYESLVESVGDNMLTIKPSDRFVSIGDNFSHPSISKDNNLMLMLMLGVSDDPHEQIIKLFEVSFGMTEGQHHARHVIVSSSHLYIVELECATKFKFRLKSTIPFKNIDYISLSINFQTVGIICHSRHEKYWIDTGDRMLSWYLAQTIQEAYSKEEVGLGKLCVLVDASIQRIAMRNWVNQESKEVVDPHLLSYTLVHWEEVTQMTLDLPRVTCSGLLKMSKPHGWHLSYYVLRDNVLHEYRDSQTTDSAVCTYAINRTVFSISHCFELELAGNAKCEFASETRDEMEEWIRLLHLAMKQPPHADPLPCCCAITPKDVLLCHEDQHTNFFRSLASLSFLDFMRILIHEDLPNCCVLVKEMREAANPDIILCLSKQEIELKDDVNHWIFHLTSTSERDRFTAALAYGWRGNFMNFEVLHKVYAKSYFQCRVLAKSNAN
ncbi:hypothetical protein CAPTEDRAFT_192982 [Capitella teleta]|uniref:PH domain-containing protein n=1 Tax=Capitella teleta TaxID=283909 RepID=R7TTM8_CAPTE|nr:hypothetical protein CAPTEDRAFT_192982 [Capitella teleta]|eukprot:ELT94355.1 hypothetical protein CAPTEDRAFT_192982 [Capitella teleta]